MRDPVLEEALRRLAAEAATRFSSLIASGEEVPFDVAEADGDSSLFYRYVPLTRKFVEAHEDDLRSLPSFGSACGAVNMKGAAVPFLEARGETVPADPDERAAKMLTRFIGELWDGCAEFTLDRTKLDESLTGIEAEIRDVHDADMLVAPLVGLQMVPPALELPGGVRVVRADTVDAPIEAMTSEGMGRKPWEPQFLALVDQGDGPGAVEDAIERLHTTITVMRLFKAGGIGVGPFAFAPTAEDLWRRVATGAAPVRPEPYELDDAEAGELTVTAGWITPRLRAARASRVPGPLGWGLRRFELGRERPEALDGLTDHLLALRAILEGDGPVGAPLPVRAAALFGTGHDEREQIRAKVETVLKLEKSAVAGELIDSREAESLAAWFEDSVRGVLRECAAGELGDDAGIAADESLLSAGLGEGEGSLGQRGDTEEWNTMPDPDSWKPFEIPGESEPRAADSGEDVDRSVRAGYDDDREEITRIMEPVPGDESEIRITAMADAPRAGAAQNLPADEEEDMAIRSDWLSEVSGSRRSTIEWPAEAVRSGARDRGSERLDDEAQGFPRQRVDTPRVRHLFPVPESDWSVRELDYDRRRSA